MPPPFLFVSQGRQIAHPFFTKDRMSDFHIFDQTSAKALNLIANHTAAYAPVDVQVLLQRFTLDAAALFLWGHVLNTLDLSLMQPRCVVLGPEMVESIGPNSRTCPLTSSVVAKVPWVL
jgi:hypothetical protein